MRNSGRAPIKIRDGVIYAGNCHLHSTVAFSGYDAHYHREWYQLARVCSFNSFHLQLQCHIIISQIYLRYIACTFNNNI